MCFGLRGERRARADFIIHSMQKSGEKDEAVAIPLTLSAEKRVKLLTGLRKKGN
jgi:hypothetical protein